jgi:hypothetical protein
MTAFLIALLLGQATDVPRASSATQLALDALAQRTAQTRSLAKVSDMSPDVLVRIGFTGPEAKDISEASLAAKQRGAVLGAIAGASLLGGCVAPWLLTGESGLISGAIGSGVIATLVLVASLLAPPSFTPALTAMMARTSRSTETALSESGGHPIVLRTTERLVGMGLAEGKPTFRQGTKPLADEAALLSVLESVPEAREHRRNATSRLAPGIALFAASILSLAAPPVIIGATDANLVESLGILAAGALVGALLAVAAAAVVGPAAEAEVKATETYNAVVFADAKKALQSDPPPVEQPTSSDAEKNETDRP